MNVCQHGISFLHISTILLHFPHFFINFSYKTDFFVSIADEQGPGGQSLPAARQPRVRGTGE